MHERLILLSCGIAIGLTLGFGWGRWAEQDRTNAATACASCAPGASELEKELTRRMADRSKWKKERDFHYRYGELTAYWWVERHSEGYALGWDGHSLWELLDEDAQKRINARAKELVIALNKADRERERQEQRKKADEEAKKLKQQP